MNIEIKISNRKISYKSSLKYLEKRVNDVKSEKKGLNLDFRASFNIYRRNKIK